MARDHSDRDGGADGEDDALPEEGGLRPFWSGVLTFGLVSVPVELYAATGRSRVAMHMLSEDGQPLRRRYVSAEDQAPLERDDLVRGFESDAGEWVTVTEEELAALEPKRSREIDLRRFVPNEAIDPMYFDRAYVLLPEGEVNKPYRLLAATMEKSGRTGVATFVLRGREVAIAIHAERGLLYGETLRHPDEIRSPEAVGLPAPVEVDARLVKRFAKAIDAAGKRGLDTRALTDEDAAALRALAEDKRKARTDLIEVPEDEAGEETLAPIVDIAALLKERLAGSGSAGREAGAGRDPTPAGRASRAGLTRPERRGDVSPKGAARPAGAKRSRRASGA